MNLASIHFSLAAFRKILKADLHSSAFACISSMQQNQRLFWLTYNSPDLVHGGLGRATNKMANTSHGVCGGSAIGSERYNVFRVGRNSRRQVVDLIFTTQKDVHLLVEGDQLYKPCGLLWSLTPLTRILHH